MTAQACAERSSFASETTDADPPPLSWSYVPSPPFAPFEAGDCVALPLTVGVLKVREAGAGEV